MMRLLPYLVVAATGILAAPGAPTKNYGSISAQSSSTTCNEGSKSSPGAGAGDYDNHKAVTAITTQYTTECDATVTQIHYGYTSLSTYKTYSTVTRVLTSTMTGNHPIKTSAPGEYGKARKSGHHGNGYGGGDGYVPAAYPTKPGSMPGYSRASGNVPTTSHRNKTISTYPSMPTNGTYISHNATMTTTRSSTTRSSQCTPITPSPSDLCVPCEGQPGSDPDSSCGYTIRDDYNNVMPKTCSTRVYNFEITNTTIRPDGIERMALLVNGQMPGPVIEASWGDTILVHVTNRMQNNGTSIHFQGIRQNYTNEMNGVPSITQCPIAPGESYTYKFIASNYGTSWYHSHFGIQAYEGVFGPLVIQGPVAETYDGEEVIVVQDWSHSPVNALYDTAQSAANAPNYGTVTLDTGLINGQNIFGVDGAANATGSRYVFNVVQNRTYRLRLVNTAIQSSFKFFIDGHTLRVIATDFVPVVPYSTQIVNINPGQRYDLMFSANQPVGNYWMRADNQNVCAEMTYATNVRGIVQYAGAISSTPTSTAYNYTESCADEPASSIVPIIARNVGARDQEINKAIDFSPSTAQPNLYKWTLQGTTFQSQWGDPTLEQIVNNGTIPPYSGDLAIQVPNLGDWIYIILQSQVPAPLPIHLHGHEVGILAQGTGPFVSQIPLNTFNPPRRDVVTIPSDHNRGTGGYVVLAFQADNPGAWLMNSMNGWQKSMGLALQIIESLEGIDGTVTYRCQLNETCARWREYAQRTGLVVSDSGV